MEKNGELIYFVFFCEKIRRNKNIYTCMLAFVKINNERKSQKSIKMVTIEERRWRVGRGNRNVNETSLSIHFVYFK